MVPPALELLLDLVDRLAVKRGEPCDEVVDVVLWPDVEETILLVVEAGLIP